MAQSQTSAPGLARGYVGYRAAIDSYLLCATPRSGSTLLCGLLRSTGVAGRPESYFRRDDRDAYADRWGVPRTADAEVDVDAFVRAAVAAGSTPNGVFGARIMWGTMTELPTHQRPPPTAARRRRWSC